MIDQATDVSRLSLEQKRALLAKLIQKKASEVRKAAVSFTQKRLWLLIKLTQPLRTIKHTCDCWLSIDACWLSHAKHMRGLSGQLCRVANSLQFQTQPTISLTALVNKIAKYRGVAIHSPCPIIETS